MGKKYAILDVETTGGVPSRDKITDIAVYLFDGKEIVKEFRSLVNPECRIPAFITGLTGISNELVEKSPKFYELARKIVEITEDACVVGHNVNFDYNFIKYEFRRLGYEFKKDTLCTVQLSKKLFPGLKAYNLGALCQHFDIQIHDRHRAAGDARATVSLFQLLAEKDSLETGGAHLCQYPKKGLHGGLNVSDLKALPEQTGVYYFFDADDTLLYVGKSTNIYKRVMTHLNNEKYSRAVNMKSRIASVDFEITGSELLALLQEFNEIKSKKPVFNRAGRRLVHAWGLYYRKDAHGYLNFEILKTDSTEEQALHSFKSKKSARKALFEYCETYMLCQKLCGLYDSAGACFNYSVEECKGACVGEESPEEYNKRAEALIRKYSLDFDKVLLLEEGRDADELAVVAVENGRYLGHGYIHKAYAESTEDLLAAISQYPDNRDARTIIRAYMNKYPARLQVVTY